jgi:hypothetical protein
MAARCVHVRCIILPILEQILKHAREIQIVLNVLNAYNFSLSIYSARLYVFAIICFREGKPEYTLPKPSRA